MFAVIKTGGKQYKVSADQTLTVERLAADEGQTVQFNDVLMLGGDGAPTIGAPFIEGAGVQAEILEQKRGPKTISFKKRRRKHSSARRKGHRQHLTVVKVTEILTKGADKSGVMAAIGGASAAALVAAAGDVVAAPAKKEPAKKATAKKAEPAKTEEKKAAPKKAAKPKAEPKPEPAAAEGEFVKPANLLDAAQGEPDDLKKISGVGPKLEGVLHENGVFHFWQIAAWGPSDILYMDDKLSFKGRIERDDWIGQATEFAKDA